MIINLKNSSNANLFFKKNRPKILEKFKQIGIDLDPYVPTFNSYDQLTDNSSQIIPREQTEAHTKQIIAAQNILLTNFHLIIASSFEKKDTFVNKSTLPNLAQISSTLGISIPEQFHASVLPNSLVDFDFEGTKKQLIIIHNLPEELKDEFEKIKKDTCVILLNLKVENLTYPIEKITEDRSVKKQINNFMDKLTGSYRTSYFSTESYIPILELETPLSQKIFKKVIDGIYNWSKIKIGEA